MAKLFQTKDVLRKLCFSFLLISTGFFASAQDSILPRTKKLQLHGYLKDLRIASFDFKGNSLQQNFLHNRINGTYSISKNLSFIAQIRTRVFYGEGLKYMPDLAKQLDRDPGMADLSFVPIRDQNILWNTNIDRLLFNLGKEKWDLRIGRQRINWGINLVWNPNDIFNTLNYTDFDYEERSGSDAIRFQRYLGMGDFELALNPGRSFEKSKAAALCKTNYKGYDFQVMTGYYLQEIVAGGGWAGSIKQAGFKGEFTWFSGFDSINPSFLISPSVDYTFKKGVYGALSFLYNSNGSGGNRLFLFNTNSTSGNLDVKKLMPNKYSVFTQVSGAFNPLVNGSLGLIYAVDLNGLFLMPSLAWSVKSNLEMMLLGQTFFSNIFNSFSNIGNSLFMRIK
jgi:hypothetical protein